MSKTTLKHRTKTACSRTVRAQLRRAELTVAERRQRRQQLRRETGAR